MDGFHRTVIYFSLLSSPYDHSYGNSCIPIPCGEIHDTSDIRVPYNCTTRSFCFDAQGTDIETYTYNQEVKWVRPEKFKYILCLLHLRWYILLSRLLKLSQRGLEMLMVEEIMSLISVFEIGLWNAMMNGKISLNPLVGFCQNRKNEKGKQS